jgi:uncharacterized protein
MMSPNARAYPQARETLDNAPYLQAWRRGKLALQHCSSCDRFIFYPRAMCPHCWNDKLEWRDVSGRGKVVSFSLVRRPNDPVFNDEAPIALAEVLLDENVTMLARILDTTAETGMRVRLAADPATTARYPLPAFRRDV